jgi:hypothetical protein
VTAHVAGVPVEELVTGLTAASGALLAGRTWLMVRLRGRRRGRSA